MANWRNDARYSILSSFRKAVYELCTAIPAGKVATYGTLANVLNASSQAVGTALKTNPFAPHVPCHRVIKGGVTPSVGGFFGATEKSGNPEISRKLKLLESEGVCFGPHFRLSHPASLFSESDFAPSAVTQALRLYSRPDVSSVKQIASRDTFKNETLKRKRSETSLRTPKKNESPFSSLRSQLSAEGCTGEAVRCAVRSGLLRGHTSGLAPGYAQANLVIVPKESAFDFLLFCQRNPKPCPLLEVLDVGCWEARVRESESCLRACQRLPWHRF